MGNFLYAKDAHAMSLASAGPNIVQGHCEARSRCPLAVAPARSSGGSVVEWNGVHDALCFPVVEDYAGAPLGMHWYHWYVRGALRCRWRSSARFLDDARRHLIRARAELLVV
jgi:hypothetical protein